jgi:SPP1 gp7 family putative phage head morphogenesis protein
MINDINNKVYSLTKFKMDYITKAMQATYEHEHKGTFTIINDAIAGNIPAGYELLYAFPDAKELNAIINLQVGGMTLEDRLTSHGRALGLALQQDITQGLILGKSYAELSKLVQARMGSDLSKAQTLVRTELNRVKNAGRLDSLKMLEDKGVTMEKEWQSLHDKWVRHSHTMLDGKKVPVTGSFKINYKGFVYEAPAPHQFGAAALDVNCRCRIVPALPDEIILDFDKMDKSK